MKLTEAQYAALKTNTAAHAAVTTQPLDYVPPLDPDTKPSPFEQRFHDEHIVFLPGLIAARFEGMKLRLAANTFYTPDWLVVRSHRIQLYETKGFWREDARVKIKCAQQMHPWFEFLAATWDRKGKRWAIESFGVV